MQSKAKSTMEHRLDPSDNGLTFLVIDDDPADRTLMGVTLRKVFPNSSVNEAESLSFAVTALVEQSVSCIVTDYHLGDETPESRIAELRSANADEFTPVIVMSGVGNAEKATSVMRAGASDYLAKDRVTPEALQRAVTNSVVKADLGRSLELERRNLVQANEELTRQSREIRSFYHTVSHELKTPLTAVREYCSLMQDEILGPVTEGQTEALDTCVSACDHLCRLVNDLFDTARMETGKLTIAPTWINLGALVERNMALLQGRAEEKGVKLSWTFDTELPEAYLDESRISQVFSNLVSNALKFTPAGGRVHTRVVYDAGAKTFVGSVTDTGEGISEENQRHIFDRLYQVAEETRSSKQGMGIGLYLCQQIVELHGGTIRVSSKEGEGSVFTFELPLQSGVETQDDEGEAGGAEQPINTRTDTET